jgi:hypothetical protein
VFLLLHRSHFARLLESAPGLRESLEANFRQRMDAERQMRELNGHPAGTRRPTRTDRDGLLRMAEAIGLE